MSWSSRFGGWAPSRWSPFTGRGDTTVTDKDFSYITAEDLENHNHANRSSHHDRHDEHHHRHSQQHEPRRTSNLHSSRAPREDDILTLHYQRISYPIHFPAYSIDDGELTIGSLRDHAARELDVADARRIRMFHKGRILKDDRRACRDEGFRSDTSSDILCVIGDRAGDRSAAAGDDRSESEDDEDDDDDSASNAVASAADSASGDPNSAAKKKKRRSRKKKSKKPSGTSTPVSVPAVEHLPIPTGTHPTHRTASPATSTPAASSRPQTPQTPRQKLDSIAATFHDSLLPQCQAYIATPPAEPAKREFEHKKLTETILSQVLLKLDAVETEGDDDARAQRKALVKEVQGWLGQLDGVVKV